MDDHDVADRIRQLEGTRYDALVKREFGLLESLLHDQLVYVHSTGAIDHKAELLTKLRTGHYAYEGIEHAIDEIVVARSTALVLQRVRTDVSVNEERVRLSSRSLTVWVLDESQWRLIAHHPQAVL